MYILAVETTGPVGSAAIIDDQGAVSVEISSEEMNHLKDLMPMAERLLSRLNIQARDLTAAAASIGPGSFTGLRIGSSTVKGLGLVLDKPIIPVPTLEGLAYQLAESDGFICPIMDARRNQV